MKNLSILIFLFLILTGCLAEKPTDSAQKEPRFLTTPPSHLYFKNLRSHRYQQTTQPGTRTDLYKLSAFSNTTQRPIFFPLIVDNWMQDEAYILIRPNNYTGGFPDTLQVMWQDAQDSGHFALESANWDDQYIFAQQLYHRLREGHRLRILNQDGELVPVFDDKQDRNHFMTTMRDYHRLTEQ